MSQLQLQRLLPVPCLHVNKVQSTTQHITKLKEFRQAIYDHGLTRARDAQFELIDALLLNSEVEAFVGLSLSPAFRRRWHSTYAAIKQGRQDTAWLTRYLCEQIPDAEAHVFPLDTTTWPHPSARTLTDMLYERSPSRSIKGHEVVQGHVYSLLSWTAAAGTSWALPIDSQRVTAEKDAVAVGLAQITALQQAWQAIGREGLLVIATDGRYSTDRMLPAFKDQKQLAKVGRMRKDRVLYREPGPYAGRGRPRKHGARFAFKDPTTWGPPDAEVEFDDERWGRVRLRQWDKLHDKRVADVPFRAILCEVHLERDQPAKPIWLEYVGPACDRPETPWRWFQQRWPIEPSIQFRKARLNWTLPQFQHTVFCDRWTWLVTIAQWQLYLARDLVQDHPLPWQKPQANLTPGRVLRSLAGLFARIGTPARSPQPRGKSPGWLKGRPRTPPTRHKPIKRGRKRAKAT
jgi:hypothetical protein